jgi:hypothetical protein
MEFKERGRGKKRDMKKKRGCWRKKKGDEHPLKF